jgi:hypothetical protein
MTTPKVLAYETPSGLTFWCIHCREWHRHGQGGGHRAAHCRISTSPYLATGYDLVVVGPMTQQVRRSLGVRR